jgi:acyl-CoA reductase-like NAD-dependent aldehyde dehydrogenase
MPLSIINPATEAIITEVEEADAAAVSQAVEAAHRAFTHGPWRKTPVDARQAILRRCAQTIIAHADELARIETDNTGITLSQAKDRHVLRAAYNFNFFADYIGQTSGAVYDQTADYLTWVVREPIGVAALISPWNAPIALGSMKIAAAIAFGNSCVIKPSEQAPLGLMRLVELLGKAGLPPDVVRLVNGRGAITGEALVRHPLTAVISFTGGTAAGRHILSVAGSLLKPATMELGGKSANIIFASADYERALDAALLSIYSNNGQQCLAGSRILVERPIAQRFIDDFVARTKALRIGSPLDPETELGPLASRRHLEHVLSFTPESDGGGVQLLTGGRRAAGFERGYYIEPTVVLLTDQGHRICQEEIFGPFAAISVFDTAQEAYALANGTRYGLVSYVWSQDVDRLAEAQQALTSGVVWCNTPMMRELRAPFGGIKDSGLGAEGGQACEALYTRAKTISTPRRPLPVRKLGLSS